MYLIMFERRVFIGAHGKRRGFSPGAAAPHSQSARVHEFFSFEPPGVRRNTTSGRTPVDMIMSMCARRRRADPTCCAAQGHDQTSGVFIFVHFFRLAAAASRKK